MLSCRIVAKQKQPAHATITYQRLVLIVLDKEILREGFEKLILKLTTTRRASQNYVLLS